MENLKGKKSLVDDGLVSRSSADVGLGGKQTIQTDDEKQAEPSFLAELSHLVDADNRVDILDKADASWPGGKVSVQGPVTRLCLTLGAMLIALGIIVGKDHPVTDAHIPMAGIGVVALWSARIERGKNQQVQRSNK